MKKNRLLILGGTSSFSGKIIERAKESKYEIFATTRQKNFKMQIDVANVIQLDLESLTSIKDFIESVRNYHFSHLICLLGSLSNNSSGAEYLNYKKYIDTYITNLIFLFDNFLANNDLNKKLKILIMSSRSAKYGSYDYLYAASKSAIEAYVKSKSKTLPNVQINCVSTGLVKDSKMYKSMPSEIINSHMHRSRNELLSLSELASIILSLFDDQNIVSGDTIYIGPQYE